MSSAWRLALPGGETNLTNAEFAEAAASNLCLPSLACRGMVGKPVRGRTIIDAHGDIIQASPLQGDHWRQRHTLILQLLHNMCCWAGVQCDLEVFNLFAGHISQEGLSRLERHQQRQGLVPDMRISVPAGWEEGGGPRNGAEESRVLHELKVISCCTTRYKPTWEERGVDQRASQLQQAYLQKARNADEEGSTVQMELYGPSKCTKLTRPNGRRSNGPPILRQFGPSKWTTVHWTVHVTSIWTVQMDGGPLDRCPFGQVSFVHFDGPYNSIWTGEPSSK